MLSRLTPSRASFSTSASDKPQDKDDGRARVEADPDLETVQEEEEVDGVFGAQGGKDTVNYRRCVPERRSELVYAAGLTEFPREQGRLDLDVRLARQDADRRGRPVSTCIAFASSLKLTSPSAGQFRRSSTF